MDTKILSTLVLLLVLLSTGLSAASPTEGDLGEPPYLLRYENTGPTGQATRSHALTLDNWNRSSVVEFFFNEYLPPLSVPMQWNGKVKTCNAGSTSQAYLDATLQMVNFFRGMSGLAHATIATSYNTAAQQAALIMSANLALSHNPTPDWKCWTADGAAAANTSNLALHLAGPNAIIAYIEESGPINAFAGHRRWIFYPPINHFGIGSVGETTAESNVLTIFTGFDPRPATPAKVAWPPEGYVPYQVVYPRWSFALNTDSPVSFSSAVVTMNEGLTAIPVTVVSRTDNGYGDNTVVWEPSGLSITPGSDDRRFTVTISNILVGETPRTEIYEVLVIDPDIPSKPTAINATDGIFYDRVRVTFNPIAEATQYRLFRCSNAGQVCGSPIGFPDTGSFDDTGGGPGKVYYYRVQACKQGVCGEISEANPGHRGKRPARN